MDKIEDIMRIVIGIPLGITVWVAFFGLWALAIWCIIQLIKIFASGSPLP